MRAKDREVAKAKEERDAGRAAERERAKVRTVHRREAPQRPLMMPE